MSKITASTFRDTLLVVLRDLADEDGVVASDAATDEVLSRHGMRRDSLDQDAHGRDLAPLLINQALNKLLKRNGLARSAGYGKWALTDDGIVAADAERQNMNATETRDPTEGGGISFSPPTPEVQYHPDEYLRSLAEQATPCFGWWSRSSDVCGRCTLAHSCIPKTMEDLRSIGARLDDRDDKIARGIEIPDEDDEEIGDLLGVIYGDDEEPSGDRDWKGVALNHENIGVDAICPHCGGNVKEDVVQVRPNTFGVKPGMYHAACFEEVK